MFLQLVVLFLHFRSDSALRQVGFDEVPWAKLLRVFHHLSFMERQTVAALQQQARVEGAGLLFQQVEMVALFHQPSFQGRLEVGGKQTEVMSLVLEPLFHAMRQPVAQVGEACLLSHLDDGE